MTAKSAIATETSFFSQRLRKFANESFNRRMAGFTLCRAWVYVSFFSVAMLLVADNPFRTMDLVYHASLLALVLSLVACGFVDYRLESFMMTRTGRIAPAAITVIGSLLVLLADDSTIIGVAITCLSGLCTGFGSGLILTYWGRIYSATSGPTSAAECALALLLGTLLIPFFAILPLILQLFVLSLLPVASAILLAQEFSLMDHAPYLPAKTPEGVVSSTKPAIAEGWRKNTPGRRLMMKASASSLVFGTVVGIVRTLYAGTPAFQSFYTHLVLPIASLAAATLTLGIILWSRRLDLALTYKPVVILMTVSCAILPLLHNSYYITYVLAMAGYFCFEIMNWAMLTDICYRHQMSGYRVFCWGRAAVTCGILIGELLGVILTAHAQITVELLYGISFGLIVLMVLMYTLTLTERDVARVTRAEQRAFKVDATAVCPAEAAIAALEAESARTAETQYIHELTIEEKVEVLAAEYGIDGRAYDVLLLLAKGRTAARIEQELYVSRGTVNTYSNRIYQKLGIHSRQQLFDLLDAIEEE